MELDNYNFKDWIELSVDDLGEIKTGSTPQKSRSEFYGIDYPFYKPTDLNAGYSTKTSIDGLSELGIQNARFFPENSILITCIGATIGKVGIIRKAGACNQQINGIVPYKKLLNPNFVYFQTIAPKFQKEIKNNASATTLSILNKGKFAKLSFYICPISEQRAIVSKIEQLFSDLDNGIDNFKKAQAQLKLYRQSVLKAACEGRLVPTEAELAKAEGRDYEPADVLLARILKERREKWNGKGKYKEPAAPDTSEMSELPEGWIWVNIDQLSEVVRGASPRPAGSPKYFGGTIPWITVREITKDKNIYLTSVDNFVTEEGKKASRFLEEGTFLLTNSGATLGVPKITLISGCINDGSVALLGLDKTLKLYLYFFLLTQTNKLRQINQGAAQPNLNTTIVKKIILPLSPLAEQHRIVTEVERRLSLCDKMEETIAESLQKAEALRQSILKKAFEGKLLNERELEEARNAPDWEPAEKLLERIRAEKTSTKAKKKGKK